MMNQKPWTIERSPAVGEDLEEEFNILRRGEPIGVFWRRGDAAIAAAGRILVLELARAEGISVKNLVEDLLARNLKPEEAAMETAKEEVLCPHTSSHIVKGEPCSVCVELEEKKTHLASALLAIRHIQEAMGKKTEELTVERDRTQQRLEEALEMIRQYQEAPKEERSDHGQVPEN